MSTISSGVRPWLIALALIALLAPAPARSAGAAGARLQPRQPAQEEFLPIDQLPPEEQLPAAPLLVAAYAFVWVAVLVYIWSLWRRLGRVERELAEVGRRTAGKERGA